MDSHGEDPIRDAWKRAAAEVQQRQGAEQARDGVHPRAEATPERDEPAPQARQEMDPQRAKQFEWQQAEYARRQREAADDKERSAKRDEYMKANHPDEYKRQQRDDAVRAEWGLSPRGAGRADEERARERGEDARDGHSRSGR